MSEHVWLIDPFDPLLIADGRPFDADPGAQATSLPFPPPSVTTGGFRTRLGYDRGGDFRRLKADLLKVAVAGPLLVRLADQQNSAEATLDEWFFPTPADAVIRQDGTVITRYWLQPLDPARFPPAQTDVPHASSANFTADPADWRTSLLLVGCEIEIKGKTPPELPRFWSWTLFEAWLLQPCTGPFDVAALKQDRNVQQADGSMHIRKADLVAIQRDTRTHVRIEKTSQRAEEGMLFQTQGLSFLGFQGTSAIPTDRFALAVWSSATLKRTIAPLGGERRLVEWRASTSPIPAISSKLIEAIKQSGHCRLVLLTPALWKRGFAPEILPQHGLVAQVQAVANQRPEIISGWDFATDRPKRSRRLAPAGTVLFIKLDGNDQQIEAWISAMWLHPLNDDEQADRDGFGIAALGAWDGKLLQEIRHE